MWSVLNPLYWLGFLDLIETGDKPIKLERVYFKSQIWRKCLRLDTDPDLKPHIVQ